MASKPTVSYCLIINDNKVVLHINHSHITNYLAFLITQTWSFALQDLQSNSIQLIFCNTRYLPRRRAPSRSRAHSSALIKNFYRCILYFVFFFFFFFRFCHNSWSPQLLFVHYQFGFVVRQVFEYVFIIRRYICICYMLMAKCEKQVQNSSCCLCLNWVSFRLIVRCFFQFFFFLLI